MKASLTRREFSSIEEIERVLLPNYSKSKENEEGSPTEKGAALAVEILNDVRSSIRNHS